MNIQVPPLYFGRNFDGDLLPEPDWISYPLIGKVFGWSSKEVSRAFRKAGTTQKGGAPHPELLAANAARRVGRSNRWEWRREVTLASLVHAGATPLSLNEQIARIYIDEFYRELASVLKSGETRPALNKLADACICTHHLPKGPDERRAVLLEIAKDLIASRLPIDWVEILIKGKSVEAGSSYSERGLEIFREAEAMMLGDAMRQTAPHPFAERAITRL